MRWLLPHALSWLDAVYASLSLALVGIVQAPGSLSAQVLRLLTRDNVWTGVQTFSNGTLELESGSSDPTTTLDRLYSIGGSLFFNGNLITTATGLGTVTSVGLTMPAEFTVTGSPITGADTFVVTFGDQTANQVWAGPATGIPATPAFRALVAADIPVDTVINGTGNVTWLSVDKTGSSLGDLATRSAGDLNTGSLALARITDNGTSGQPLVSTAGGGPQYAALNLATGGAITGTLPAARMPAMTGDATSTVGTVALTLATSGVVANTYGSASAVPVLTIDAKGRVTAASTASLTGTFVPSLISGAVRGAALIGNSTPQFAVLTPTVTGSMLRFDGTDSAWSTDGSGLTALNATNIGSGTVPVVNGGTGQTATPTDGQLLIGITAGNTYNRSTLTGTANQILVTNGPGTVTLATPQAIATSSAPQFARIGLGTGADPVAALYAFGPIKRRVVANGSSGAAIALDLSAGDTQTLTLTNAPVALTLNNPVSGVIYTLHLLQDGTGSRTVTWPTIKWTGGSAPTLTTTLGKTDIITLYYDGTSYYGSSSLNY